MYIFASTTKSVLKTAYTADKKLEKKSKNSKEKYVFHNKDATFASATARTRYVTKNRIDGQTSITS